MGCSSSKLDDAEAVQLCRDRKRFIKQAVVQRARFAAEHLAYIQSMKRVSAALLDYIQGNDPRELLLDSLIMKKASHGLVTSKTFSPQPQLNTTLTVNYLKTGGNSAVSVLETPPTPEIFHIQAYSPVHHCGVDGLFSVQSSTVKSWSFLQPALPQPSQWDFFWDPFSSLDYYGYSSQSNLDQMVVDEDSLDLEEERVPISKQDETKQEEPLVNEENGNVDNKDGEEKETVCEKEVEHEAKGLQSQDSASTEVAQSQDVEVEENHETAVCNGESKEEESGFTVYAKQRPTCMADVIRDLEAQFMIICHSANEILTLLEGSRAHHPSNSNETTAMNMLNPVALFHSASSGSSSSQLVMSSSIFGDEGYESSSCDFSEESCMFSGSHQSTLDRLYAWEKKLYEEVRAGERVRIAYEKKYVQLRNQNVKGESSAADKTRVAIRYLQTQIKVSKHSIEVVSSRIESLREEELQPQLLELLQGLTSMWKVMAECHQTQKQTLHEANLLLCGTPSKLDAKKLSSMTNTDHQRLASSAGILETEVRNWQACFEAWTASQLSYMQALAGWLLRCVQPDPKSSKLPFLSPRPSSGALPIFGMCIQWARSLDAIEEKPVVDGLDSFAAMLQSLYGMKSTEEQCCGGKEVMEVDHVDEATTEKMGEVGIGTLCVGLSIVMNSLTDFAAGSAEGYGNLLEQWEKTKCEHSLGGAQISL